VLIYLLNRRSISVRVRIRRHFISALPGGDGRGQSCGCCSRTQGRPVGCRPSRVPFMLPGRASGHRQNSVLGHQLRRRRTERLRRLELGDPRSPRANRGRSFDVALPPRAHGPADGHDLRPQTISQEPMAIRVGLVRGREDAAARPRRHRLACSCNHATLIVRPVVWVPPGPQVRPNRSQRRSIRRPGIWARGRFAFALGSFPKAAGLGTGAGLLIAGTVRASRVMVVQSQGHSF